MASSLLTAALTSSFVLVVVACSKPTAGESCKNESQQVCADEREALVCVDSKWERLTCRGIGGCKSAGSDVSCANDSYASGEPCDPAQHDYECGPDKVSVVRCKGKHWRLAGKCPGPKGCTSHGQKVSCDDSIADVGMPCAIEGSAACSGDKSMLLKCKNGAMIEETKCRGAKACDVSDGTPRCDTSVAQAGDPCNTDDDAACAADGKQLLRCRSHVMVSMQTCKGACRVSGSEISCN
jgi:hypothetical protein